MVRHSLCGQRGRFFPRTQRQRKIMCLNASTFAQSNCLSPNSYQISCRARPNGCLLFSTRATLKHCRDSPPEGHPHVHPP